MDLDYGLLRHADKLFLDCRFDTILFNKSTVMDELLMTSTLPIIHLVTFKMYERVHSCDLQ